VRVWHKTVVTSRDEPYTAGQEKTFAEHARAMGGYDCAGYESVQRFFAIHFVPFWRLHCYESFLRTHLSRGQRTFSIACGRGVNEMRLVHEGFNIVCSDLEPVCPDQTGALFPGYQFKRWNAFADPLPTEQFDAVICLGFASLLSPDLLQTLMNRARALLVPGGLFILDSAGAPDNVLSTIVHDVAAPIDARIWCTLLNVRARLTGADRWAVRRKMHGYRYRDSELISAAARCGFALEDKRHMDFDTEWQRLFVYRYLTRYLTFLKSTLRHAARPIPYVRMFSFRAST
jgi:SAM-dependent methyltransferase